MRGRGPEPCDSDTSDTDHMTGPGQLTLTVSYSYRTQGNPG